MPPVYTPTEINSRLSTVVTTIDAGGSHGFCNIFNGSNTLLAQLSLQGPPCGTVAAGVLTFTTPWTAAQAVVTGVPVSANITDSTGAIAVSGLTVGTIGSTSDIVFADPTLTVGKTVIVNSATITGH